jgi:hypothetical protein
MVEIGSIMRVSTHENDHGRHIGLRGQIPGRIWCTDCVAIASRVRALGHHLLMDLNNNEAINGSLRI